MGYTSNRLRVLVASGRGFQITPREMENIANQLDDKDVELERLQNIDAELTVLREQLAVESQAAVDIAAACLNTGLVPKGVTGTVDAVREVCARLAAARVAVESLPMDGHRIDCPVLDPDEYSRCECGMMATIEKLHCAVGAQ